MPKRLLTSCSFNFVTLSLNNARPLSKDKETGENLIDLSLLDHYATRSTLLDINFITFVANYSVCDNEVHKRSPVVVRTFPQLSSDPMNDQYGEYQLTMEWADFRCMG